MEKISVLMSTYSEPLAWIRVAVDSILQQTYSNIEFIIVQDKPEREELTNLLEEYRRKDSRILLLKNPKNLGLVESLNAGLKLCTGEYIARMDADDISHPDRLEKQMDYMKKNRLDIVGSGYIRFDDSGDIEEHHGLQNPKKCVQLLHYRSCLAHPSWMVKKSVYKCLNGYRKVDSCEDYDFLVRAALRHFRLSCVEEPLVHYRENPNSISHEKIYQQRTIRDFIRTYFSKGMEMPMENLEEYLQSQRYQRDFQNRRNAHWQQMTIKDSLQPTSVRLQAAVQAISNPAFWNERLANTVVKRMK